MKPIIISVIEEKDGYIRLKKENLEKYIQDAYESGLKDGSSYIPNFPISPILEANICEKKSFTNPIEINLIGVD